MKKLSRGTTPFPNVLLDTVLPTLSDTAWRVLCVIVRATYGWHRGPGRRKERDWLTHSQLKGRTGRHSEAISKALHELVSRNLICIHDDVGAPLHSGFARRGRKRLYFSLASAFSESEFRKAKTTKETHTKENIDRKEVEPTVRIHSGWTKAHSLVHLPVTPERSSQRENPNPSS